MVIKSSKCVLHCDWWNCLWHRSMRWQTSYHPLLAIQRPSIRPCKEKEKNHRTKPYLSLTSPPFLPPAASLSLSPIQISLSLTPRAAPSFPRAVTGGALLPSGYTRTSLPLPALLPPPLQLGFRLPDPQSPKLGSSSSISDGGRGRSSSRSSTSRPSLLAALAGDCLRGDNGDLVIPGGRGAPQGRPPPRE